MDKESKFEISFTEKYKNKINNTEIPENTNNINDFGSKFDKFLSSRNYEKFDFNQIPLRVNQINSYLNSVKTPDKKIPQSHTSGFLSFNPNLLKPQADGNSLTLEAIHDITPQNIAEFAYPIVQFIAQTQPDYVMALDRGARLYGLAVMLLYQELYGKFPTRDHQMNFRRISKSVDPSVTAAYLRKDAERMHAEVEEPRILVLDDWVGSGRTKELAQEAFVGHNGKAKLFFGVMRGPNADVSGKSDSRALPAWKDDPEIIGVDYKGTEVVKVPSKEAILYRQEMATHIKAFAAQIKALQSPSLESVAA